MFWAWMSSRTGFIAAGVLNMAIGPITQIMLPICNNTLREMGEKERQGRGNEIREDELKDMVQKFEWLNYVRGAVILAGDAGPGPLLQALKAAHEAAPPVLPPSSPLVQSAINVRDYRPTHYSRQLAAGAAPPTKETRQATQESPQHTTDSRQPAEETHRHTADSRRAVNRKESPHHTRQAEGRVQPLGDSAQPFEDLNQPGKEPPQHTDDLEFEPESVGGSRISPVRWKHFSGCWWQSPSFSTS
ncbi:hypothetical protein KCV00_g6026, partial [Aureobasidium melanogenum]